MKCRDRFSPSPETGIDFTGIPSQTKQYFQEEVDINNIIRKYTEFGQLPQSSPNMGVYGDFADVDDYQTNMQKVIDAQNAFDALPANVRNRFSNDPVKLMEFLHDKNNLDEAIKLGLANPKPNIPVQDSLQPTHQTQNQQTTKQT